MEICGVLEKNSNEPCALATVIHVEGSAYRRPGARMLITPNGHSWGMISGGCLEHDVLEQARHVLQSGVPRVVRYDSTSNDDIIFGTGLGCNGVIDVFIEPVTQHFRTAFVNAVDQCHQTRQPGAIATIVGPASTGRLTHRHAFLRAQRWTGPESLLTLLENHLPDTDMPAIVPGITGAGEMQVFVQPLLPPLQLVVFGGWLDVMPLIRIGREIGFRVIAVDARRRESSLHSFREADSILLCSPADAVSQIKCDNRTVAVLMNHHFEGDQEALAALTRVSIPFIGMLGPKRRQQKILEGLKNSGVQITDEFIATLHGPVGLDLGAKTPEEIALSISAEILAVLSGRTAEPIRDRIIPAPTAPPTLAYA